MNFAAKSNGFESRGVHIIHTMRLIEASPDSKNVHFDCRVQAGTAAAIHAGSDELYPGWARLLILFGGSGVLWFAIIRGVSAIVS